MRFAALATAAAAIAALPLAAALSGPQMTPQEFLTQVRCAANPLGAASTEIAAARIELNWEALDQPAEVVAQAREIVREAAKTPSSMVESMEACGLRLAANAAGAAENAS